MKLYLQIMKKGKPLCIITGHSLISCSISLIHENGGSAKINSKITIASTGYHVEAFVLFYNRKRS